MDYERSLTWNLDLTWKYHFVQSQRYAEKNDGSCLEFNAVRSIATCNRTAKRYGVTRRIRRSYTVYLEFFGNECMNEWMKTNVSGTNATWTLQQIIRLRKNAMGNWVIISRVAFNERIVEQSGICLFCSFVLGRERPKLLYYLFIFLTVEIRRENGVVLARCNSAPLYFSCINNRFKRFLKINVPYKILRDE